MMQLQRDQMRHDNEMCTRQNNTEAVTGGGESSLMQERMWRHKKQPLYFTSHIRTLLVAPSKITPTA